MKTLTTTEISVVNGGCFEPREDYKEKNPIIDLIERILN